MTQIKLSQLVKENQFKRHIRESFTNVHYQLVAEALGQMTEDGSSFSKNQIEDILLQTVKDLKSKGIVNDVPKDIDLSAMEKDDHAKAIDEVKQRLTEGATVLLAIPGILSLLGRAINWIYRKINFSDAALAEYKKRKKQYQKLKRDPRVSDKALHEFEHTYLKNTLVGDWLKNVGHTLHGWLEIPLRFIIAGIMWMFPSDNKSLSWSQCWNKARQLTNTITAIVIGIIAGYGAVTVFLSKTGASLSSSAMAAIEGLDVVQSASSAVSALQTIDVAELTIEIGETLV